MGDDALVGLPIGEEARASGDPGPGPGPAGGAASALRRNGRRGSAFKRRASFARVKSARVCASSSSVSCARVRRSSASAIAARAISAARAEVIVVEGNDEGLRLSSVGGRAREPSRGKGAPGPVVAARMPPGSISASERTAAAD